jgi:hypothetical protein
MARSSQEIVADRASLVDEMASGELGDQRLNGRRDRLIAVLEQHPDTAFPDACADDAEVEALYRFFRNRRLSLPTVIEPHVVATQARCAALGEVLVIHDTTDVVFAGETPRTGLTPLGRGRQGFWLHAALAVSADGLRTPLGVLSLAPFMRAARSRDVPKDNRTRFVDPDKESRCWPDGVAAVRRRVGATVTPIHVMDRAGDSYELFAEMLKHGDRFVIRLNHDRRVVTNDGPCHLSDAAPRSDVMGQRQVRLSPRLVGDRSPKARQQHPPRAGRMVTLQFAARGLTLQRPQAPQYAHLPPTLRLQVIYAWETAAPPGEVPIEWRLITTEPIETIDQVLRVVDWYRARWLIEEWFKALKTGCAYEKRQLASLQTLLIALALLAPIAWQLLLLRYLARDLADAPAHVVLSARQLHLLRASPGGTTLRDTPTIRDALFAVARLGGHLRQNGEPGWLVLGRGMQKLLYMEAGWAAAEHARTM